jgi:hypothetical protein
MRATAMTDLPPSDPAPTPPPARSGPVAIALIGAGIGLLVVGQGVLNMPAMTYAGFAILTVGVVFGVISQRGT